MVQYLNDNQRLPDVEQINITLRKDVSYQLRAFIHECFPDKVCRLIFNTGSQKDTDNIFDIGKIIQNLRNIPKSIIVDDIYISLSSDLHQSCYETLFAWKDISFNCHYHKNKNTILYDMTNFRK